MNKVKLIQSEDLLLQLPEEFLTKFNIKPGDKVSLTVEGNSLVIKPIQLTDLDIDLSVFSQEELIALIQDMAAQDMTVNEYIEYVLSEAIKPENLKLIEAKFKEQKS